MLDFPTGNLGDAVGYKTILLTGYIFQIIAVPFLLFDDRIKNSPLGLTSIFAANLVFMIIYAIGTSQESGALEAWLDNRYRVMSDDDSNREMYKHFQAKAGLIHNVMSILGFVLGGAIATLFSRKVVFSLFLLLLITTLVIILVKLTTDVAPEEKISTRSYLRRIQESFGIFLKTPVLLTYFLGIAFMWAANASVWYIFLLFKLYLEYTGSDAGAGGLRGIVYLSGLFWQILVIRVIHRFKKAYLWVFLSAFISNVIFFSLVLIYYQTVPPGKFSLFAIAGFLLIYQIPVAWEALQGTLQQRINLDLIPDEYRNSLYSLLPTLAQLFGVPFVFAAGWLINGYGFESVFYLLIVISLAGSFLLGLSFKFAGASHETPAKNLI